MQSLSGPRPGTARAGAAQAPQGPSLAAPVLLPPKALHREAVAGNALAPRSSAVFRRAGAVAPPAAVLQTLKGSHVFDSGSEEEITISRKALQETHFVRVRVLVPYFVTKPGQQLMVTGSSAALGEWDTGRAVPMLWQEGHLHTAEVELPAGKLIEAKLVLFENGSPVYTEQRSRDILLMPSVNDANVSNVFQAPVSAPGSFDGHGHDGHSMDGADAAQACEFQILCAWDQPEVTEVLRLPVMLPPRKPADTSILCKIIVLPDTIKLEGRQRPVLVGNIPELGNWDPEKGAKLMRQVGGHWTCRVSLPLSSTNGVQAKVVICDHTGKPVAWEPGTTNRNLALHASGGLTGQPGGHMLIFTCQWSNPGVTPTVAVPVEYEPKDKEHMKQLDAACREISVMRQAMTAKARQAQQLETELVTLRRMEREARGEATALRAEAAALRSELEKTYEELDTAVAHRDEAREQAELSVVELNEARKVVDMARREVSTLREQMRALTAQLQGNAVAAGAAAHHAANNGHNSRAGGSTIGVNGNGNGNGHVSNGNGNGHVSNGNGNGAAAPRTVSPGRYSYAKRSSSSNGNGGHEMAGAGGGGSWRSGWRS